MEKKTKRRIGTALMVGSGAGMLGLLIAHKISAIRFRRALEEYKKTGRDGYGVKSDYALNSRRDGVPSVFTDEDAALRELFPKETRPFKKRLLKDVLSARIKNPQYHTDVDSVFIGKDLVGTKVLGHELGHAADRKNLEREGFLGRFPLALRNFLPGFYNPDRSSTLRQEMRAWDNAGVGKGDRLREAALDTYRTHQRFASYSVPLTLAMLAGGITYIKNER